VPAGAPAEPVAAMRSEPAPARPVAAAVSSLPEGPAVEAIEPASAARLNRYLSAHRELAADGLVTRAAPYLKATYVDRP